MKTKIVTGLGFGDEGKGLTTDYLCSQARKPFVIRFNGGHQAGHTVVRNDGKRHVFSSLGSGSLRGAPTYWSSFCTFYPIGFLNEYRALMKLGVRPEFYLDHLSPVTTYYDVVYNRALEESRDRHGSCGLGFGATIERHESFPKLFAQDLLFPDVLRMKLRCIGQYYSQKVESAGNDRLSEIYFDYDFTSAEDAFLDSVSNSIPIIRFISETDLFEMLKEQNNTCIFEGAQGILLDMDFGFFPHVTRSNTTSKNAVSLIRRNDLCDPEIYYVTRSYQSRHGAGPMTNEDLSFKWKENKMETNVFNPWQGSFRRTVLDMDLLRYSLTCDGHFSGSFTKNLVITCLDQTGEEFPVTEKGITRTLSPLQLANAVLPQAKDVLLSSSDRSDDVKRASIVNRESSIVNRASSAVALA